jgi:Tol biopolymer transport system component
MRIEQWRGRARAASPFCWWLRSAGVVSMFAATALAATPAQASYPGRNGEIVFSSSSGWAMDPDGGNQRRLMRDPEDSAYGGFRADGRRYVFTSCRGGLCGIYTMGADGGHVRRVPRSPGDAAQPRFGPDGKRIVYELDRTVYIVGTGGRRLRSLGPGREPVFSPNGRWIAYDGEDGHMRLVRPDGTHGRRVTHAASSELAPSFSPDGRRIAFIGGFGWSQIYVMDLDGGNLQRLTNFRGGLTGPVFSPDGRSIAFGRNQTGHEFVNWDVYVMNSDGTDPRRLTRGSSADIPTDWQPLP